MDRTRGGPGARARPPRPTRAASSTTSSRRSATRRRRARPCAGGDLRNVRRVPRATSRGSAASPPASATSTTDLMVRAFSRRAPGRRRSPPPAAPYVRAALRREPHRGLRRADRPVAAAPILAFARPVPGARRARPTAVLTGSAARSTSSTRRVQRLLYAAGRGRDAARRARPRDRRRDRAVRGLDEAAGPPSTWPPCAPAASRACIDDVGSAASERLVGFADASSSGTGWSIVDRAYGGPHRPAGPRAGAEIVALALLAIARRARHPRRRPPAGPARRRARRGAGRAARDRRSSSSAACCPTSRQPGRWTSTPATRRRRARCRSAATGTTSSSSTTARVALSRRRRRRPRPGRRRRRWASCAAPRACSRSGRHEPADALERARRLRRRPSTAARWRPSSTRSSTRDRPAALRRAPGTRRRCSCAPTGRRSSSRTAARRCSASTPSEPRAGRRGHDAPGRHARLLHGRPGRAAGPLDRRRPRRDLAPKAPRRGAHDPRSWPSACSPASQEPRRDDAAVLCVRLAPQPAAQPSSVPS